MFVSVKSLTAYIDKNIGYVLDAKEHHTCSDDEYKLYMLEMRKLLQGQLVKLEKITSNKKLLKTYHKRVSELFI